MKIINITVISFFALYCMACTPSNPDSTAEVEQVEDAKPHCAFKVIGKVLNARDKKPLKGIRITISDTSMLTEEDGSFELEGSSTSPGCCQAAPLQETTASITCNVKVYDDDGSENGGVFETKYTPVDLTKTKDVDGWNIGTFESTTPATIELGEKK